MTRQAKASSAFTHGRSAAIVLAFAAALSMWLICATGASAAPKGVFNAFGSAGTGEGEFASNAPSGIAVNQATGDLYVVDTGNHRVQRLTASGAFASQIGTGVSGNLGGQFNSPRGVAIDPDDGSIYVTDGGNLRVQKFSAVGNFLAAWGFNVDSVNPSTGFEVCTVAANCKNGVSGTGDGQFGTTFIGSPALDADGDIWVADGGQTAGRRAQLFDGESFAFAGKFGGSGTGAGQFGTSSPSRVAIGADGSVYAVDFGNVRVQKCTPSGEPPAVTATCANFYVAPANNAKPVAVAVNVGTEANPGDGNVLILRRNGTGTATNGEAVVDEYEADGTLVETHALGAGIAQGVTDAAGRDGLNVALRTAPGGDIGRIFVTNAGGGTGGSPTVFVLTEIAAPAATLATPTGVTADQATFSGTVNPNGSQTSYRFEYTTNGIIWTPVQADQAVGSGNTPVNVSQTATGLIGGQAYQVRLVATKPYGNPGDTTTPTGFMTAAAAPTVALAGHRVETFRAQLGATVNPNNQSTGYRFEYGTTTSYGNTIPMPDGKLAAATKHLEIAKWIEGLQPDTTYHYRFVATNATGTSTTANRTLTTPPTSTPPEGRAYEMVSPPAKEGNGVSAAAVALPASDGESVAYPVFQALSDAVGNALIDPYLARRGETKWSSQHVGAPTSPALTGKAIVTAGISEDLSRTVLATNAVLTPDGWPGQSSSGLLSLYLRDENGQYHLITPQPLTGSAPYQTTFVWGNADYTRLLFETPAVLTADAPASGWKLYEWEAGTITLASVLPGDVPAAGTGGGGAGDTNTTDLKEHAISADGEVVWFTSPGGATGPIYRRENGETHFVNASENGSEVVPPGSAQFYGATPDGQKVLFTSTQRLVDEDVDPTPGAPNDLYMYTHSDDPDTDDNLTLLSEGALPEVLGVLGMSEDGSRVYFASALPSNIGGIDTDVHIYLWDDGDLRHIGTAPERRSLTGGTQAPWNRAAMHVVRDKRAVASDGSALLLGADAELEHIEPDGRDTGGLRQVFHYSVEEDRFRCISCPADGTPASSPAVLRMSGNSERSMWVWERRNLSDDGRRAFFVTAEPLAAGDINGAADVYMWEDGEASLISSGKHPDPSFFMGSSGTGDSVFFLTWERLSPWDVDGLSDIYAARIGGGLPDPVIPPPPCRGEACQGPQAIPAPFTEPGSDSVLRRSRIVPLPAVRLIHMGRAERHRLASGRWSTARVVVREPGTVRVRIRAHLDGRLRVIASGQARARQAGRLGVRLRLSRAARRALARERALTAIAIVRGRGGTDKKILRLTRRAGASRGGTR